VDANVSGQVLYLDPANAANTFVNQGLFEATGGGILQLSGNGGGSFSNAGGTILANGATSQVQLVSGANVTGGTLSTINGGTFSIDGTAAADQITGTSGTITVTAAGALSAVNGIDFSGAPGVNAGTLTLSGPSFTFGSNAGEINGATFNGGDGIGSGGGASGGILSVTADGAINVNVPIMATTGSQAAATAASGNGGQVNLTSTTGAVTINSGIEVSSKPPPINPVTDRRSAAGGDIDIQSGASSGVAINVTSSGTLLSLLESGQGGTIALNATGSSSEIDVKGTIEADFGTVDIEQTGSNNGAIVLGDTMGTFALRGDTVKVAALGTNGALNIGQGTISADTVLKLYAGGTSGTINFNASVTLSGNSAKIIAAHTINIFGGVTLTINGPMPADIYTDNPNYAVASGGNGTLGGTINGTAGAHNPQPFASAPPLGASSQRLAGETAATAQPSATPASSAAPKPTPGAVVAGRSGTTTHPINPSATHTVSGVNVADTNELLDLIEKQGANVAGTGRRGVSRNGKSWRHHHGKSDRSSADPRLMPSPRPREDDQRPRSFPGH
jgi:hypothetical protein